MCIRDRAAEAFERYLETGDLEYAKIVADYLSCSQEETEDEEC